MNYLVYDEISVITELNVEILSEVLYANFIQLTV
jgi:hypothetical protein